MRLFQIAALAALAGVALVRADDEHGENAVELKEKGFEDALKKGAHFVMFFAPWCGHCKRLAPIWDKLAEDYIKDEKDVVIGKVDCTKETSLCSSQDVTGYPTLKFFKDGPENGVKHRGQRDQKSLEKFINEQMGRAPTEEEEIAMEPEEAVAEKGLFTLTEKSFKNHVAKGDTFIKFYAPWCGHCKKLAPTWDELAAKMGADGKATIAKVDCTKSQSLCQEHGIKGYPTLAYFRKGEKVEAYRGGRTMKDLSDFVASMSGEEKKAEAKEEVTEDAKDSVAVLSADNFESTIAKGVTFVKFYAPWCGHCKRLAPTWVQLADKYASTEGVTIAKVDCTSNDNKNKELCNAQGVNGFPTLNIYKDGEKVDEFNGKRGLDDLAAFVDKTSGKEAKDEL